MLYVFTGTDRKKARTAMQAAIKKASTKGTSVIRVTDANSIADLQSALQGKGMFESHKIAILEGIFTNEEMRPIVEEAIPTLARSDDTFFILEEKPNAAAKKLLEKHAERIENFDAAKAGRDDSFFLVTNTFRAGKKKELWVLLQREYAAGKAPEAVHGTLFWAAKQMVLKLRGTAEAARGRELVAELTELPHEARRRGEELEYALERFVLSRV